MLLYFIATALSTLLAATAPPLTPMGRVVAVEGNATVVHGPIVHDADEEVEVFAGDQLRVAANGKVRIKLADYSVLALGGSTQVVFGQLQLDNTRNGRITITAGKFWLHLVKWVTPTASRFEIETPSAVATVRGTILWGDTELDAICSIDGLVEVASRIDKTLTAAKLKPGYCVSELGQAKLTPLHFSAAQTNGYVQKILIK